LSKGVHFVTARTLAGRFLNSYICLQEMNFMERIILEVDDQVAKNWRYSSEKKRQEVNNTVNKMLEIAFKRKEDDDFIQFIKGVQDKASERGLTEDILNDILNEPD
jgi:hypothetical protein